MTQSVNYFGVRSDARMLAPITRALCVKGINLNMYGKSSPEKILNEVEIYLSDINVPNYAAVQALKKGIKAFPESIKLKEKLKEIESSNNIGISSSSPKMLYGILVIAISLMGLGLLISYFANTASSLALFLGSSFLIGALVIFNQYRKEK